MAETGGSLKNIGPHPEISMHTPMVRKIPTSAGAVLMGLSVQYNS